MSHTLTHGNINKALMLFSAPMILGNLLQQLYNVADTVIVGKALGAVALSAVGSAYTLMVLLTSIVLGLCMGSSVVFSRLYAAGEDTRFRKSVFNSALVIIAFSLLINLISYAFLNELIKLMNVPSQAAELSKEYLSVIFVGFSFVTGYNFFASILRSVGNTKAPLYFLGAAAITNIVLDIVFVVFFDMGVAGAAYATIIAQALSAILIIVYFFKYNKKLFPKKSDCVIDKPLLKEIISSSTLTAIQQSIMNFGILMVQSLVNSFGTAVSAAFAIVVKIDAFAYMPAQDFGNAFATFVAQNHGANNLKRIKNGFWSAIKITSIFCVISSLCVNIFSKQLIGFFLKENSAEIIQIGTQYLRIEGALYIGIGILFVLYGFYRGMSKAGMSVVLTIISLGSRVVLAYALSAVPILGVSGIWLAVPIGWALADAFGIFYYFKKVVT